MEGFSYNGIHSSEMGVQYVPDEKARGDYFSDYEVIDSERAWFSGGEYCKPRVKTRVFELDCYYEQVTRKEKERIIRWLDRRTQGKLIFDNRPYAVYSVRPTKKIIVNDYLQTEMGEELYSGTFTIQFSAYDPFAELTIMTSDGANEAAMAELGLIPSAYMPPAVMPSSTDALIYNPGTETGHSVIRFAGETGSSDFIIYNSTTGERCILKAGLVMDDDEYYEIDSKTGSVKKMSYESNGVDFAFHDEGQITFAPSNGPVEKTPISTTNGSKRIISSEGIFTEADIGRWVYLGEQWRYIGDVISSTEADTNTTNNATKTENTYIVDMNYITITKASDAKVTKLEIILKAEVR